MHSERFSFAVAMLAIVGLVVVSSMAQIGNILDVKWHTIDAGGGGSTGGGIELAGTIGQPEAGSLLTGGAFALAGGFWPAFGPVPASCPPDITGEGLVNIDDLLAVIYGWGLCPSPCPPNCPPDIGGDCTVNVNDLLAVISGWGICPLR